MTGAVFRTQDKTDLTYMEKHFYVDLYGDATTSKQVFVASKSYVATHVGTIGIKIKLDAPVYITAGKTYEANVTFIDGVHDGYLKEVIYV